MPLRYVVNAIKGDTSYKKSAAITKALTREYGLTFGKGKKNVRRERLKGKDAIKYRLYDNITEAMKDSISWQQLRKALKVKGISLDFCRDNHGSVCGVTFTDIEHHVTFAGGKLDRSLTFGNIDRQMYNIYEITDDPNDQAGFYPHYDSEYITHVTEKYGQDTHSSRIEDAFDFTPKTGQGSSSSSGSNIGAVMAEVLLQPHVVPTSGGGGGYGSSKDEDDDWENEKNRRNNFTPRRR